MDRVIPGLFLALVACQGGFAPAGPSLALVRDDAAGVVTVRVGAHEVLAYQFGAELALPHLWPLRSPSGKDLLVQHPDPYPHHRALWIADHVQLEGGTAVDFYHCWKNLVDKEKPALGYRHAIRHRGFSTCAVAGDRVELAAELQWLVDGAPVLDEERVLEVLDLGDGEVLLDLSWSLRAAHGAVTFRSDQVHYAWPYLRVHPRFSVQQGGVLVDDRGRRGQQGTNEQYALWVDYSNEVDGVTEGVTVFVPDDGVERKWLTRDYGCFGPRRPDALSGTKFVLGRGEVLRGRVGILVHRGDAVGGRVAERYRRFVAGR